MYILLLNNEYVTSIFSMCIYVWVFLFWPLCFGWLLKCCFLAVNIICTFWFVYMPIVQPFLLDDSIWLGDRFHWPNKHNLWILIVICLASWKSNSLEATNQTVAWCFDEMFEICYFCLLFNVYNSIFKSESAFGLLFVYVDSLSIHATVLPRFRLLTVMLVQQ